MKRPKLIGLVIDDDERVIEVIKTRYPEYKIESATTKKQAEIEIKSQKPYHFMIVDYKLGSENGLSLITSIRAYRPMVSIMVLTGYAHKQMMIEVIEKKPDGFIEKPINFTMLAQKITQLVMKKFPEKQYDHKRVKAVHEIRLTIDKSPGEHESLEKMAQDKKINYKELSRWFKDEMGDSFRQYVVKKKIEVAKKWLKNTDLKVIDIALRLGYVNPNSLMKQFKKEIGLTPIQYRNLP